jgi:hypothetical protein
MERHEYHSLVRTSLLAIGVLAISCQLLESEIDKVYTGTVAVLHLEPQAGDTLGANSTLRAKVRYSIDNYDDNADARVSLDFGDTTSWGWFLPRYESVEDTGSVDLTTSTDTIELAYPMTAIFHSPQLGDPIRVRVTLASWAKGSGSYIAKSGEYMFYKGQ